MVLRYESNYLCHYGVPGMKWGHRKALYDQGYTSMRKTRSDARSEYRKSVNAVKAQNKQIKQQVKEQNAPTPEQKAARRKKAIIAGSAIAVTALAAYGGYKLNNYIKTTNCQIAAKKGYEYAEKMFQATEKGLTSGHGRLKGTISANSGASALDAARRASNDSFKTAAKNVYRYKKSGGDLRYLDTVRGYASRVGSYTTYG